ncbi:MAG: DNA gyrase subunit A [Chitinophagaceae bacterium]|nr:MAG: DNA gyrase subunit A [Chitinophagaceae bacterium]
MDENSKQRVIPINIEEEMKSAYIDYSMSVIVSRAIPDVRDGLKPVHRRVLYGMFDLGVTSGKSYKKSARIVGEVLGKYHPHGDSSVYDAMVRMAQPWSLRYPLVDGQGNFGSIDGDNPAAMRYTEARLAKISEELLADIDKDTVDFTDNFDDTLKEPSVLPSKIPNLLINGASGIAVGMATNILPHNLSEVIDGINAYIDDNDIDIEGLIEHVKAPDFPTGGIIYGYDGVKEGLMTGRGRVVVRGKAEIEENGNRSRIIVTEIPYQVNKSLLLMRAADLVNEKKIEGITGIRDESDRNGMRIIFELRKDAVPNVVLNQLYNFTPLQTSYGVNNIALVNGRPKQLNLKDLIRHFVDFRHEVVVRRTKYDLREAEKKAHILEGLLIALDHLDEVIALIRSARTPEDARNGLMSSFELSEEQARAILDLRLQKLTGLERDKIKSDYEELLKKIAYYKEILESESLRMQIIKDELNKVKEDYGDERKTTIEFAAGDMNIEDLIPDEEVIITISHLGYIKRTLATEYRAQSRGGRGSKGGKTRDEDFIEYLFVATTHNTIMFFTELGRCYWLKVYEIPEGTKVSLGRAIQNVINFPKEDSIRALIKVPNLNDKEYLDEHFIMFCTENGVIKKTPLEAFSRPRSNGINAITIRENDRLLEAKLTDGKSEVILASKEGRAIRFNETKVRSMGRTAAGVRGMVLGSDDNKVVGMVCLNPEKSTDTVLVVSEKGYGKRSNLDEYRITNRGGKGVKTINVTDKTGKLVTIKNVSDEDDLMIINRSGILIRMGLENIRVMGRATQGVRLIRLGENDEIAATAKIGKFIVEEIEDDNESQEDETQD